LQKSNFLKSFYFYGSLNCFFFIEYLNVGVFIKHLMHFLDINYLCILNDENIKNAMHLTRVCKGCGGYKGVAEREGGEVEKGVCVTV